MTRPVIAPVLVALALLALPAAAAAQAQTSLQALPSPFGPGATISLSASIVSTDPPSWCGPPWCAAFPYAWIAISGSNGFWAFADAWDTQVSLQTGDAGPGQTLQTTSYQAVGEIVWMICEPYWDCSDPGEHVEHGSAQAQVVPQPAPSISLLDPGSGLVGTPVTISGAHFTGTQGTVTFNGVAASLSHWSDTSLTVTVPGGATSGPVVVTAGASRATAPGSRS